MAERTFPVVQNTVVTIKVAGDLQLEGWDRPLGSALSNNHSTLKVHVEEPNVTIYCADDCMVSLPATTEVIVERVGGDACVRQISGKLQMQKVGGDLALQKSGASDILMVGGDCLVEEIDGALHLSKVGGDLTVRRVKSELFAVAVGGDANVKDAAGAVTLRAGGDITAALTAEGICNVELHAGGDIDLNLPAGAGAALNLTSRCHDIRVLLGDKENEYEDAHALLSIGDERFKVVAEASGDVTVSDEPWNEEMERDFEDDFRDLERDWSDFERARAKLEHLPGEIEDRVNRKVQEAMRRAEPKIEEAMRKAQSYRGAIPPVPPGAPVRPVEPAAKTPARVSDEERLIILQMLQEKKISPEEADRLLDTLENLS